MRKTFGRQHDGIRQESKAQLSTVGLRKLFRAYHEARKAAFNAWVATGMSHHGRFYRCSLKYFAGWLVARRQGQEPLARA